MKASREGGTGEGGKKGERKENMKMDQKVKEKSYEVKTGKKNASC